MLVTEFNSSFKYLLIFHFLKRLYFRSNMTIETDVNADASTLPVVKEKAEHKPKSPRGGRNGERVGLDEAQLERDFKNFSIKLRKQFGEDVVAYQVSNYPEGLEFSVRVAKNSGREGARFIRSFDSKPKTEKKEMTEEQKAKRALKQAKRREYLEKRRQEKLENAAKDKGEKASVKEETNENGDSAKDKEGQ